jgi:hypothetical protein
MLASAIAVLAFTAFEIRARKVWLGPGWPWHPEPWFKEVEWSLYFWGLVTVHGVFGACLVFGALIGFIRAH